MSALARGLSLTVLMALSFAAEGQGRAESFSDRFEYRIGGQLFSHFDSVLRLDSQTRGIGTKLRLEDDVDLEERIRVARMDGLYSFNRRHHIAFAAYDVDREGTRNIQRDIRFGEEIFTIDTFLSSKLEERIVKVSYIYTPWLGPRVRLGPSFGLHVMQIEAALAVAREAQTEGAATTAPLPVIGVHGQYWLAERWRLRGALEWFDIDFGDVDGLFTDVIVSVEHQTFDRFGFGLGINNLSLDVESGDADFRGQIDLSFRSVLIYFKGSLGRRSVP